MIKFKDISSEKPYSEFISRYEAALKMKQENIEAISISSYSRKLNEVNSRYVNLKLVDNKDFIFFTNYKSPKAQDFKEHNQVTALIYWNSINTQIRIKAYLKKTSKEFNQIYFSTRSRKKNALAISSKQSQLIDSYKTIRDNFNKALLTENLTDCPEYWGGFALTPYYFEFWKGHKLRLNKRLVFEMVKGNWKQSILEP